MLNDKLFPLLTSHFNNTIIYPRHKILWEIFGYNVSLWQYAQVVVEDFDYDGMQNTSCTTLYEDILADQKLLSYPSDYYLNRNYVITHELAHQWFGDLVTCQDWSHNFRWLIWQYWANLGALMCIWYTSLPMVNT